MKDSKPKIKPQQTQRIHIAEGLPEAKGHKKACVYPQYWCSHASPDNYLKSGGKNEREREMEGRRKRKKQMEGTDRREKGGGREEKGRSG